MPDFSGIFSGFFEGAVGVVVLFAAISWASSKIVEVGQILFNAHGKMLRAELARWFGEDEDGPFTRYFYWHPLIEPLSQPPVLAKLWGWLPARWRPSEAPPEYPPRRLPAYIAPETFTAFAVNPFPWPTTEMALRRLLQGNSESSADPAAAASALASDRMQLAAAGTWEDLFGAVNPQIAPAGFDAPFRGTCVDLRGSGGAAPDSFHALTEVWRKNRLVPRSFCSRMVALLGDSEGDIERFRTGAARWYNEAMDRLTGRFKRKALIWIFAVAFGLCTLLNVNSLALFTSVFAGSGLHGPVDPRGEVAAAKDPDIPAKRRFKEDYLSCVRAAKPSLESAATTRSNCLRHLLTDLARSDVAPFFWALPLAVGADFERARFALDYCTSEERNKACGTNLTGQLSKCVSPTMDDLKSVTDRDLLKDGLLSSTERSVARTTLCRQATLAIISSPAFFWDAHAASELSWCLINASPAGSSCPRAGRSLTNTFERVQAQVATADKVQDQLPNVHLGWAFKDFSIWSMATGLVGIFISALLAALGAPFWYDLLAKISGRGATGPKPVQV
jgi:hypothetical protein